MQYGATADHGVKPLAFQVAQAKRGAVVLPEHQSGQRPFLDQFQQLAVQLAVVPVKIAITFNQFRRQFCFQLAQLFQIGRVFKDADSFLQHRPVRHQGLELFSERIVSDEQAGNDVKGKQVHLRLLTVNRPQQLNGCCRIGVMVVCLTGCQQPAVHQHIHRDNRCGGADCCLRQPVSQPGGIAGLPVVVEQFRGGQ